ncbi:MAG: YfcE family phosphodiesterase [Planctomycetaceae bacterium]|nr:YfcE family phosphodiesterase [Planctomycetaceae bacterium]
MRLGIISDTHGNTYHTHRAVEEFRKIDVDVILHCGDVGSPGIVSQFQEWPTHFVAGNCDDCILLEQEVLAAEQQWHHLFGDFQLFNRRIALLHSHVIGKLDHCAQSGDYDLVCYGHTHQHETHSVGNTTIVNPGAMHRAVKYTIALVNLATMQVEHFKVEC